MQYVLSGRGSQWLFFEVSFSLFDLCYIHVFVLVFLWSVLQIHSSDVWWSLILCLYLNQGIKTWREPLECDLLIMGFTVGVVAELFNWGNSSVSIFWSFLGCWSHSAQDFPVLSLKGTSLSGVLVVGEEAQGVQIVHVFSMFYFMVSHSHLDLCLLIPKTHFSMQRINSDFLLMGRDSRLVHSIGQRI